MCFLSRSMSSWTEYNMLRNCESVCSSQTTQVLRPQKERKIEHCRKLLCIDYANMWQKSLMRRKYQIHNSETFATTGCTHSKIWTQCDKAEKEVLSFLSPVSHNYCSFLCGLELFLISYNFLCVIAAKRSTVRGRLEDAGSERVRDRTGREDSSLASKQDISNFAVFIIYSRRDRKYFCVAFIEILLFTVVSVIIKMHVYIKWMLYQCHSNWK